MYIIFWSLTGFGGERTTLSSGEELFKFSSNLSCEHKPRGVFFSAKITLGERRCIGSFSENIHLFLVVGDLGVRVIEE
jgi:hypothetical protein